MHAIFLKFWLQTHFVSYEKAKQQICPLSRLRLECEGSWCPSNQVFMALDMLSFHGERRKDYSPLPGARVSHPLASLKHSGWFWKRSTQGPGSVCWAQQLLSHIRGRRCKHTRTQSRNQHRMKGLACREWHGMCVSPVCWHYSSYSDARTRQSLHGRALGEWLGHESITFTDGISMIKEATKGYIHGPTS